MLNKIYMVIGTVLIGGYATGALMGWEYFKTSPKPKPSATNVRQSRGGHVPIFFWYSGFRGGK